MCYITHNRHPTVKTIVCGHFPKEIFLILKILGVREGGYGPAVLCLRYIDFV